MRIVGILLAAIGVIWAAVAWNMETVVTTESTVIAGIYVPSQKVHNMGLIESRRSHLMQASVMTIAGVLLLGFGVLSGRGSSRKELNFPPNNPEPEDNLPHLYTGRGLNGHDVDDLPKAEASLRAAGIIVRRSGSKWELQDQNGSLSYIWSRDDLIATAKARGTTSS
jgi:hypothetical protein